MSGYAWINNGTSLSHRLRLVLLRLEAAMVQVVVAEAAVQVLLAS